MVTGLLLPGIGALVSEAAAVAAATMAGRRGRLQALQDIDGALRNTTVATAPGLFVEAFGQVKDLLTAGDAPAATGLQRQALEDLVRRTELGLQVTPELLRDAYAFPRITDPVSANTWLVGLIGRRERGEIPASQLAAAVTYWLEGTEALGATGGEEIGVGGAIPLRIPLEPSYPSFPTHEAADAWFSAWSDVYRYGGLTDTVWPKITAHYSAEVSRIENTTTPPAGPAPPAEPPAEPPAPPAFTPSYPTFATVSDAAAWFNGVQQAFTAGTIDEVLFNSLATHYQNEVSRLQNAEPPKPIDVFPLPPGAITEPPASPPATPPVPPAGVPPATGGVAGLTGAGVSTAIMTALGIGTAGLTTAGLALQRGIGNSRHQGALACAATTFATIASRIAATALPLAIPAGLLTTNAGRSFIDNVSGAFFDLVLDPDALPSGRSIDEAPQMAGRLLVEKMALGASAHLWSATMEATAPGKTLGLNTLAAAMSDLAGFHRLAAATLGQVEMAAVERPMRQYANRRWRTMIPSVQDITRGYAKRELPPGPIPEGTPPRGAYSEPGEGYEDWNFYELMSRQGFDDPWIRMMSHHLYEDPSFSHMIRMGQYFNPALDPLTRDPTPFIERWIGARPWLLEQLGIDEPTFRKDWWLWYKAANIGLEPADVRIVVSTVKRAVLRREQTLFLDAATRLYRDGFAGGEELRQLTEEAWGVRNAPDGRETFTGDPITARVRATELRTEYELRSDARQLILRAVKTGAMSEWDARTALADLGMPDQRVRFELLRQKLGLLPGVRLTIPLTEEPAEPVAGGGDE